MIEAPLTEDALLAKALALEGLSLHTLANQLAWTHSLDQNPLYTKGKAGSLLEWALGANNLNKPSPDFTHLGIELKTIPLSERGVVLESTFVCSISIANAENEDWETSRVRSKLAHVLWVPIIGERRSKQSEKRIGKAFLWKPTIEQELILKEDFNEIMGRIAIGQVENLSAHVGQWLQARPKAAHSRIRVSAWNQDGDDILVNPKGFYLRPRFTSAILSNPVAIPFED